MTQFYSELVSATEDVDDEKLKENNEDLNSSQGNDLRSTDIEAHPGQSLSIQKTRQIAVLKVGQYFGERALLQNDVRGATGNSKRCICTICPRPPT